MRVVRPLIGAVFCLMLALTGQAMAFARAQAPAEGQVLICSGHGSFVVYVDAEGQPTSPPQLCVDCLHLLLAAPAQPFRLASHLSSPQVARFAPTTPPPARRAFTSHAARAPPPV